MKRENLKHGDWTDSQCVTCGTTLKKQEVVRGFCFVCKEQTGEETRQIAKDYYKNNRCFAEYVGTSA